MVKLDKPALLQNFFVLFILLMGVLFFTACSKKGVATHTSEFVKRGDSDVLEEAVPGGEKDKASHEIIEEGSVSEAGTALISGKYNFSGIQKVMNAELLNAFEFDEYVNVVVLLKNYKAFEGAVTSGDSAQITKKQEEIKRIQEGVLKNLDPEQFILNHRFGNILGFSGKATEKGITALAAMPEVELIKEDSSVVIHQAMEEKSTVSPLKELTFEEYQRMNLPHDEKADIRQEAIYSLGESKDEKNIDYLTDVLLNGRESYARASAALAIGKIGGERAVDSLILAIEDDEADVRQCVVEALGGIGGDKAINALKDTLSDNDEDVRISASEALKILTIKGAP